MSASKPKSKPRRQFTLPLKYTAAMRQKAKVFRSTDPVLSVVTWGIHHTINQMSQMRIPVMLMMDDFIASTKIKVDNHLFNKEVMPGHFKFKEYCPVVFRHLREKFGVDDQCYAASFSHGDPLRFESSGRSGSRFIISYDRKYCIKTISSEEVAQLHAILQSYHKYIVEHQGQTLLPQLLACYRTTVNDQESYMLVMRSVFSPRLKIHKKYDLKGSTVDRSASEKEKEKELPTFKDNDFVAEGCHVYIGSEQKQRLMATLDRDIGFLSAQKLMDYSMLVAIHDCALGNDAEDEADFIPGAADSDDEDEEEADESADDSQIVPPSDDPWDSQGERPMSDDCGGLESGGDGAAQGGNASSGAGSPGGHLIVGAGDGDAATIGRDDQTSRTSYELTAPHCPHCRCGRRGEAGQQRVTIDAYEGTLDAA